jgi:hypothetical protein
MIHLPNSFTEPEETACGLVFGPVIGSSRVIRDRDEWWSVNCARCLNSPRGLALLRLAEATEEVAELNARATASSGRAMSLSTFNARRLGTSDQFVDGVPI